MGRPKNGWLAAFWTLLFLLPVLGVVPLAGGVVAERFLYIPSFGVCLAAGLLWGLLLRGAGFDIKVFFLACVVVAGLYGAATVGRKILFVQALAAVLALALLFASA
jgi:hypothetical protein